MCHGGRCYDGYDVSTSVYVCVEDVVSETSMMGVIVSGAWDKHSVVIGVLWVMLCGIGLCWKVLCW